MYTLPQDMIPSGDRACAQCIDRHPKDEVVEPDNRRAKRARISRKGIEIRSQLESTLG